MSFLDEAGLDLTPILDMPPVPEGTTAYQSQPQDQPSRPHREEFAQCHVGVFFSAVSGRRVGVELEDRAGQLERGHHQVLAGRDHAPAADGVETDGDGVFREQ